MSKREFIAGLKEALALKMNSAKIQEQVDFYTNYIESEVEKGRAESDVVAELGDPWMVAKNIEGTMDEDAEYVNYSEAESGKNLSQGMKGSDRAGKTFVWSTNSGAGCWIVGLILMIAIFAVLSLFVGIMKILSPILLPILVVVLLIKIFKS